MGCVEPSATPAPLSQSSPEANWSLDADRSMTESGQPKLFHNWCACPKACWPYRSRCHYRQQVESSDTLEPLGVEDCDSLSEDDCSTTGPEEVATALPLPVGVPWAMLEKAGPQVKSNERPLQDATLSRTGAEELLEGIGAVSRRGQKRGTSCPNQDSVAVLSLGAWRVAVVLDGHGYLGHEVAAVVRSQLLRALLLQVASSGGAGADAGAGWNPKSPKSPCSTATTAECSSWGPWQDGLSPPWSSAQTWEDVAVSTFQIVHNQLQEHHAASATLSGCTATLLLSSGGRCFAASVGDSAAVLAVRQGDNEDFQVVPLTKDHRPDLPAERSRIEASGGSILEAGQGVYRLKAGRLKLAFSRAFGDLEAESLGLSSVPGLGPGGVEGVVLDDDADSFVLVCSDGVWDCMTAEEAVSLVQGFGRVGVQQAAEALANEAQRRSMARWGRGQVDDISVVLSWPPPVAAKSALSRQTSGEEDEVDFSDVGYRFGRAYSA